MSIFTGVNEDNQPTNDIISGYVGEIKMFGFSGVPAHCLACDGSAVSRTTYPELFAAIGTTWGAGDGSTTFNIPDLRGYFLRGVGGNSAGLAAEQGDAIRNFVGYAQVRAGVNPAGQRIDTFNYSTGVLNISQPTDGGGAGVAPAGFLMTLQDTIFSYQSFNIDASRNVPTAAENRPINKAVNYIIVYE